MKKMKFYDWIVYIILVLAGINWGLTAFDFNIVEKIGLLFFRSYTITYAYFKTIIYWIIGLAGIYGIYLGIKLKKFNNGK